MPDDVIANKAEIIEKCLKRIHEIYAANPANLYKDQLCQDALMLNLERACQAAIDLAMRQVRKESLGLPKESREAFTLLDTTKKIPTELSGQLKKMVAFRNIAIHDYQILNLKIVETLIQNDFKALREFIRLGLQI